MIIMMIMTIHSTQLTAPSSSARSGGGSSSSGGSGRRSVAAALVWIISISVIRIIHHNYSYNTEASQRFLPPSRVLDAEAGPLPPPAPEALRSDMCIYIYIYIHIGRDVGFLWRPILWPPDVYIYIYIYIERERERYSQTEALRFVCVSDTHGRHRELTPLLPAGDVLLHAGDFCASGELEEVRDFARWLRDLPYGWKVVIAGNHDLPFDGSQSHQYCGKKVAAMNALRAALRVVFCSCFVILQALRAHSGCSRLRCGNSGGA